MAIKQFEKWIADLNLRLVFEKQ